MEYWLDILYFQEIFFSILQVWKYDFKKCF